MQNQKTNKRRILLTIIIVILYFYSSCFLYEKIADRFQYMYNFQSEFSISKLLLCVPYIVYISFFLYLQLTKNNISNLFLIVITLLYFLPGSVLYIYGNFTDNYFIFYVLGFVIMTVFDKIIPNRALIIRKGGNVIGLNIFGLLIAGLTTLIVFYYNGINLQVNFAEVYGMREDWANSSMPNIFNYYIPFAARITPILMVLFIYRKNFYVSFVLGLSQLISFGFGGMKYTFFALFVAILIYCFFKAKTYYPIIYYILIFNVLAVVEYLIYDESLIATFFQRRLSYIPNQIGYYYYDFFSHNEFLYFRDSFLRLFGMKSPYDEAIPHVIANYAFNRPYMGANTGLFAEGFSQIGWVSVFVYPLLYIAAFRFYEYCIGAIKSGLSYKIAFTGVVLYSITFVDGAYFSILLTQGFILSCLSLKYLSRFFNN